MLNVNGFPKDTNIPSLESAIRENCECMLDKPIKDVSLSDIIVGLFDTARRFKLEVQPQLILMQKTLFIPRVLVENLILN